MKYLTNELVSDINNFYFKELFNKFDAKSYDSLSVFYEKHLYEVDLILYNLTANNKNIDISKLSLIDIGGGLGINSIILTKFFKIKCTVLDRLDEFDSSLDRVTGNDFDLKERLNFFNVKLIKDDFIKDGFNCLENSKFDAITCFSVIEHFYFSPKLFFSIFHTISNSNTIVLISTPNQLHLLNRIRALFGINIWEDFNYYYNSHQYYGHVREYIPKELIYIGNNFNKFDLVKLDYSNFPLKSNPFYLSKRKSIVYAVFNLLYEFLCIFNKSFKFHLTLILKKK